MLIADPEVLEREISALIYELHMLNVDCTTYAFRLEELVEDGNMFGLRDLQNEIVDKLEEVGWS